MAVIPRDHSLFIHTLPPSKTDIKWHHRLHVLKKCSQARAFDNSPIDKIYEDIKVAQNCCATLFDLLSAAIVLIGRDYTTQRSLSVCCLTVPFQFPWVGLWAALFFKRGNLVEPPQYQPLANELPLAINQPSNSSTTNIIDYMPKSPSTLLLSNGLCCYWWHLVSVAPAISAMVITRRNSNDCLRIAIVRNMVLAWFCLQVVVATNNPHFLWIRESTHPTFVGHQIRTNNFVLLLVQHEVGIISYIDCLALIFTKSMWIGIKLRVPVITYIGVPFNSISSDQCMYPYINGFYPQLLNGFLR